MVFARFRPWSGIVENTLSGVRRRNDGSVSLNLRSSSLPAGGLAFPAPYQRQPSSMWAANSMNAASDSDSLSIYW